MPETDAAPGAGPSAPRGAGEEVRTTSTNAGGHATGTDAQLRATVAREELRATNAGDALRVTGAGGELCATGAGDELRTTIAGNELRATIAGEGWPVTSADDEPRAANVGGRAGAANVGGGARAFDAGVEAGAAKVAGGAVVRIGIVGCGGAAERLHLPALARVAGARVVALADVDAARLARVADRFGVERRCADFRDALEGVDAVAVCVPPRLHAEVARAAFAAGRHVFVEKPLALSLAECDQIAEAASSAGVLASVGFNLRFHRLAREARAVVASGALGRVKLLRTVLTSGVRSRTDFPAWRTQRGEGGGAIFELGVHHFDLARFLLADEFAEVLALWPEDETATFVARTRGGAQVLSAFCEGTGESHEVEVFGERGSLRFSCHRADGIERLAAGEYAGGLGVRLRGAARTIKALPRMLATRGGEYLASYEAEWRHFVSAARGETTAGCTLADGRRAVEVALAAAESAATGRAVKINDEG